MSKIFVVEDDQFIARVYERAFRLAEHEVEIAINAEEAWAALSTTTSLPSVILLDITLPKMSGLQLLENIRKKDEFARIPIAVLTNSFDEDIEKKVMAAGADLYLLKIDNKPTELLDKIVGLINKSR